MAEERDFSNELRWQMREGDLAKEAGPLNLLIKAAEDLVLPQGVYLDKTYFVGVNALYCRAGRFRFSFSETSSVILRPGELLVLFPRQFVTIEALESDRDNRLAYAIASGSDAEEYFWRLGFFNGFRAFCAFQETTMTRLANLLEATEGPNKSERMVQAVCLFHQMMRTVVEDIRQNSDAVFFDAVRQITRNTLNGLYHVKPLCDQLSLSRSQLHRVFVRNGAGSLGQFIRTIQLQYVLKLLQVDKDLSLTDIAKKTGFASQANLAAFIHFHTGLTPLQVRGRAHPKPLPNRSGG